MLRRIPANLQDNLALGITTGAEIVVQKIVKLEPDFMIVRGRLAGTQDSGRIVLVPYGELTFVAIQQFLKDVEVEAIFGKGAPVAAAEMVVGVDSPVESQPEPQAEEATVSEPPAPVNPPRKSDAASQQMLLAKLRKRLKEGGQGPK